MSHDDMPRIKKQAHTNPRKASRARQRNITYRHPTGQRAANTQNRGCSYSSQLPPPLSDEPYETPVLLRSRFCHLPEGLLNLFVENFISMTRHRTFSKEGLNRDERKNPHFGIHVSVEHRHIGALQLAGGKSPGFQMQVRPGIGNIIAIARLLIIFKEIVRVRSRLDNLKDNAVPFLGTADHFDIPPINADEHDLAVAHTGGPECGMAACCNDGRIEQSDATAQDVEINHTRVAPHISQRIHEIGPQKETLNASFLDQRGNLVLVRHANDKIQTRIIGRPPVDLAPISISRIHADGCEIVEAVQVHAFQRRSISKNESRPGVCLDRVGNGLCLHDSHVKSQMVAVGLRRRLLAPTAIIASEKVRLSMKNDPRMLLIDLTALTGPAATSMLKSSYFSDWEEGQLLQLQSSGRERLALSANGQRPRVVPLEANLAEDILCRFKPQIIFYRPVADHPNLHSAAMDIIGKSDAPLVLWLMDDWPARLAAEAPENADHMDTDLRELLKRSSLNYAISHGMADVFGKRYAAQFSVAHNGVRPEDWPPRIQALRQKVVLRYAGSLAPDTTASSVFDVAQTVAKLAGNGVPLRFEIHTQNTWMDANAERFNALSGVTLSVAKHSDKQYRDWLRGADILLLAYNFDEATRRYLQYSFANKTPELLASGAPVLAYGPPELETINYLIRSNVAAFVTTRGDGALLSKLKELTEHTDIRNDLAGRGREHAFREMNIDSYRNAMREELKSLAARKKDGMNPSNPSDIVVRAIAPKLSPYRRAANTIAERAPYIFDLMQPLARSLKRMSRR